jgi:hypothetical protein
MSRWLSRLALPTRRQQQYRIRKIMRQLTHPFAMKRSLN